MGIKSILNFFYTLWVYRSCIRILRYIVKSCHQHSYGFQNLMSSWGVGVRFSKLPLSHGFFKIMPKVGCFKNTRDYRPFFQNLMSSWGVGVWFSKLQFSHDFLKIMPKVWDFSLFWAILIIAAEVSTKPLHSPFGVQRNLHTRRVAASLTHHHSPPQSQRL